MKQYKPMWRTMPAPIPDCPQEPVMLTDETIKLRTEKVLERMRANGLDQLIVYGDVEHGGNFEYLVGYFTRFEEALLLLNADGSMALALGNENLNKAGKARIEAAAVHVPIFSLPDQPDTSTETLTVLFKKLGVRCDSRLGVAGWKLFTAHNEDNTKMFDVPAFILDSLRECIGENGKLINATGLFIGEDGARITNNANEIAHYEYGAALASDCVLAAMDKLGEGVSECELGDELCRFGQHTSIVTIAACGERFVKANMFPTRRTLHRGDPVSLTVGYRGGSSSRSAVAVKSPDELPPQWKDYLPRVAAPYFAAYAAWLENIRIGMTGGEMFEMVDTILPRAQYGWKLCPGHLTAEEEWLSSPIYENSHEFLRSGMIFQIDIIPSVAGYPGVCAESTVVLADEKLRAQIEEEYPAVMQRMMARAEYIRKEIGIDLPAHVLPMCSTVAYLRPCLLAKEKAFTLQKGDDSEGRN